MAMTPTEQKRLEMAERVCVLYGWGPAGAETEISEAQMQAWMEWVDLVGLGFTAPERHPELDEEAIAALAAKRRSIRAETLGRLSA